MKKKVKEFKFIDLFAGIGGFHQAMKQLGGKCVLACEIDKDAAEIYEQNYHLKPFSDIFNLKAEDIPHHDVLCAGFPCQAFSKAGKQQGFKDLTRGTLFFEIIRILEYHHPEYLILENVRNLIGHDNGNTWKIITGALKEQGYRLTAEPLILSPHQFGVPQLRERVIILGKYEPENSEIPLNISFDNLWKKEDNSVGMILSENCEKKYQISEHDKYVLTAWNEFYKKVLKNYDNFGFPIWSDYWKKKKIPKKTPKWKRKIIEKNWELYESNKEIIDNWLEKYGKLRKFTETERKLEWQAGKELKNIWEGIIQKRPSGIRVKKPDCFPALVAMVQTPIIGKYKRYLTPEEAGRLQSFPSDFKYSENDIIAYKQFGNSVNVEVIKRCAEKLFRDN